MAPIRIPMASVFVVQARELVGELAYHGFVCIHSFTESFFYVFIRAFQP